MPVPQPCATSCKVNWLAHCPSRDAKKVKWQIHGNRRCQEEEGLWPETRRALVAKGNVLGLYAADTEKHRCKRRECKLNPCALRIR